MVLSWLLVLYKKWWKNLYYSLVALYCCCCLPLSSTGFTCAVLFYFFVFFFFWWRLCWSCIFLCILVHIHTENIKNWFVFGQHLICISSIANSVDKSVVPAFLQLNSSKSWFQNRWCFITTWLSKFVVTVLPQLDNPPTHKSIFIYSLQLIAN